MSIFDDLQPTKILILNALPNAVLIEQQFGQFLIPPPHGVYKIGEVDPCMHSGQSYYYKKKEGTYYSQRGGFVNNPQSQIEDFQLITDINKVNSAVYDRSGKLVIPEHMMQQKEKYLTSTPTVPHRGVLIVELLINKNIHEFSDIPTNRYRRFNSKIEQHIDPRFVNEESVDTVQSICKTLFMRLNEFINGDTWHMYFVKRQQFDIYVEKTIDYRIHEYNKLHSQQDAESS
jgi:hypothetical protein